MTDDPGPGIALEPQGEVAVLRLNRPHVLNAIDQRMREEWIRLLHQIEAERPRYRALIVTGSGRAFCSGGDVNEQDQYMGPTAHDGWHGQYRYQELVRLQRDLSIPVIAAVNGIALGGGMAVALMADFVVASEDAEFGVGQVLRGFVPDVGLTYLLPRMIGTSRALKMMMLYERVSAEQGLDLGFVNWTVPAAEVMPKAMEIAQLICESPAPAIEWIKRITYEGLDLPFNASLRLESMAQGLLANQPAFTQGLESFRSGEEASSPVRNRKAAVE